LGNSRISLKKTIKNDISRFNPEDGNGWVDLIHKFEANGVDGSALNNICFSEADKELKELCPRGK
jgi:hypothetical protein